MWAGDGGITKSYNITKYLYNLRSSFKNCLSVELIGSGFIEKLISVVD